MSELPSFRTIARGAIALVAALTMLCAEGAQTASQELESVPDGEPNAIETIVSQAISEMDRHYPPGSALVRRDAHAKAHGCAKAIFRVDADLPADLRVGFVSRPTASYKAWVRFSNGAFSPGDDSGPDGRGMALKILSLAPGTAPQGPITAHDILMINHPTFFSPDARDYEEFADAGALTGDRRGLLKYFVPSFNPLTWRLRQAWIAYSIASQKIDSPLSIQYYSMAPFGFGPGRAIKYSARPCHMNLQHSATSDTRGPNFLEVALKQSLSAGPACFDLLVQERKGPGMPIEDTTVEWSEEQSPYRRVGVVDLPKQTLDNEGQEAFCENLAFTPWNAPPEHKPLGGINRVRRVVYEKISGYRHTRNGTTVPDAAEAWDRF